MGGISANCSRLEGSLPSVGPLSVGCAGAGEMKRGLGRRPKESDFSRLDDAKYLGRTPLKSMLDVYP